jgi:hypothetical protein
MRSESDSLKNLFNLTDPATIMNKLREMKNNNLTFEKPE